MQRITSKKIVSIVSSLLLITACGEADPAPSNELIQTGESLGAASPSLHFGRSGIQLSGTLTAGRELRLSYDADRIAACKGTLNDGRPAWSITGYASVNGGEPTSFHLAGFNSNGGTTDPVTAVVPLAEEGELQLWFQITNRWGCQAWDSAYGRNFRFQIAANPAAPDWLGNLRVIISRAGGGCDAAAPLQNDGFTFGTWARSRAADTALCFEAWEPGVTDWANPELWKQLDARIYYRYGSTGPFEFAYVDLEKRVGNNARYRAELRGIDPFRPYQFACPAAPLTYTADGFYVNTTMEFYLEVNGKQLRPSPNGVFLGHFDDYVDAYRNCP